jgi:hypothetical protein
LKVLVVVLWEILQLDHNILQGSILQESDENSTLSFPLIHLLFKTLEMPHYLAPYVKFSNQTEKEFPLKVKAYSNCGLFFNKIFSLIGHLLIGKDNILQIFSDKSILSLLLDIFFLRKIGNQFHLFKNISNQNYQNISSTLSAGSTSSFLSPSDLDFLILQKQLIRALCKLTLAVSTETSLIYQFNKIVNLRKKIAQLFFFKKK